MLKMADQWGTKLLTPEELVAELKKFKPLPPPQDETSKHYKGTGTSTKELGCGGPSDPATPECPD